MVGGLELAGFNLLRGYYLYDHRIWGHRPDSVNYKDNRHLRRYKWSGDSTNCVRRDASREVLAQSWTAS